MIGLPGRRAALLPIAAAGLLAVLHVGSEMSHLGGDAAGPTAISTATSTVFVLCPVVAAVSAWQVGRLRRGCVMDWSTTRPWLLVLAAAIADVVIAGWAGLGIALGRAFIADPAPPGGWGAGLLPMIASAIAMIGAFAAGGALAGWRLPPMIALPLCLIGGYLFLVWPIALEPVWLRHLTGFRSSCCSVATEVLPRAAAAPAIVALALVAATSMLIGRHPIRAANIAIALVPIFVALMVAVPWVRHLGVDAVRARSSGLNCSRVQVDDREVGLCTWAEHEEQAALARDALVKLVPVLDMVGQSAATRFTEEAVTSHQAERRPDVVRFGTSSEANSMDVVQSLVAAAVTPSWSVRCVPEFRVGSGGIVESVTLDLVLVDGVVWMVTSADDRAALELEWGPARAAISRGIAAMPPAERSRWYQTQRASLLDCSNAPAPLPL